MFYNNFSSNPVFSTLHQEVLHVHINLYMKELLSVRVGDTQTTLQVFTLRTSMRKGGTQTPSPRKVEAGGTNGRGCRF